MRNTGGKNIVAIIGMTGCGKSTVGSRVAAKLGWEFVDLDRYIEKKSGVTVREFFDSHGESSFRSAERDALDEITSTQSVTRNTGGLIISCGGGAPVYKPTAELLRSRAYVVWLRRSPALVMQRERVMLRPPINGIPDAYAKRPGCFPTFTGARD